jgi:Trypsin-like peptidase domain
MRTLAALVGAILLVAGCAGAPDRRSGSPIPTASPQSAVPTAAPVTPDPRVGAVFLGGGTLHTCTASVLHSRTGDLVLTAAHCLADGIDAAFVPGFSGSSDDPAPAGMWQIKTVYLDPRWLSAQDPRADYAIARVVDSGGSIEQLSGRAFALGTAPDAGTSVTVTGYALGEGGGPVGCQAATELVDGFPSVRCGGLVDGTSGAPWVNRDTVTGVTGGRDGGGCDGDTSYSSPFDGNVATLLARAEAGGPGDAAPNAFVSDC